MNTPEQQVHIMAKAVSPPFTRYVQTDASGASVETGELPRALALVAGGADPVAACEQVLDERVANQARSIRARDGDPYPPCDLALPAGERRKRALEAIGEDETSEAEAVAKARAEAEAAAAAKDAEIAELRAALEAATAPPEKEKVKS